MRYFFIFFILLLLQIDHLHSLPKSDPNVTLKKNNGQQKSTGNNSRNRNTRCTPCEQSLGVPAGRSSNSEYRGNGADNLGYDWSPKAWGGPAHPQKLKSSVGDGRGRDGRQMSNWNNQDGGNIRIICDTCRAFWNRLSGNGGSEGSRGREFPSPGGQNIGRQSNQQYPTGRSEQPEYWSRGPITSPNDYETRVSSGAVGVLVKPGSRIAYVPSYGGDMFWDGISGGGTRWDGFSNGISWVFNGDSDYDRSEPDSREEKHGGFLPGSQSPDGGYFNPNHRPWNEDKGPSNWDGSGGRTYYFVDGYPNQINSNWRDRGYASNWQYGSTNQNGWNGSNMKWSYSKNWDDQ